jgi:hypothetical protein
VTFDQPPELRHSRQGCAAGAAYNVFVVLWAVRIDNRLRGTFRTSEFFGHGISQSSPRIVAAGRCPLRNADNRESGQTFQTPGQAKSLHGRDFSPFWTFSRRPSRSLKRYNESNPACHDRRKRQAGIPTPGYRVPTPQGYNSTGAGALAPGDKSAAWETARGAHRGAPNKPANVS